MMKITSEYEINQIVPHIKRIMTMYKVPALALALVHKGDRVLSFGLGNVDVGKGLPTTVHSVFQAGSISKALTAWGIVKLIEEGKVELDAPVDEYLTRWHLPQTKYDNTQVTLRSILSHTSGLSVRSYYGTKRQKLYSIEDSLTGTKVPWYGVRAMQAPGKPCYSGGGFTLLQMIIEEASGISYEAYMKESILVPLGMTESTFSPESIDGGMNSKAYGLFGGELPVYRFVEKAAAGLHTTLQDMTTFLQQHKLESNAVLSENSMKLLFARTRRDLSYALAYKVIKINNRRIIISNGVNRGWGAILVSDPYLREGITIMTNSMNGVYAINEILAQWYTNILGIENFMDIMFMKVYKKATMFVFDKVYTIKYGLFS